MQKEFELSHPLFDLKNEIFQKLNQNIQYNLLCLMKLIKFLPNYNLHYLFDLLDKKQRSSTIKDLIKSKYDNCQYNDNLVELLEEIFDGLVDCDYYIIDILYSVYGNLLTSHCQINANIYTKYMKVGSDFTKPARKLENIKPSCDIEPKLEFIVIAIMSEMLEIIERITFKDSFADLYSYLSDNINTVVVDRESLNATDILINIICYNKLPVYDNCFDEVHEANLRKRVYNEKTNQYEYIFNSINGVNKIMKPPGFIPPSNKKNIINWLDTINFRY